jgi:hypothetical protein
MDTTDFLPRRFQRLFALLKFALWNIAPDENLFAEMTEQEWDQIVLLAKEQGVSAIVFDGVARLNPNQQPPHAIKLAWIAQGEKQERRYAKQKDVAGKLKAFFAKHNIRMLLFKGIEIASYYPVPAHREFGDLDIFLFDKVAEGERLLLSEKNAHKSHETDLHAGLHYQGISVESHRHFLHKKFSPQVAAIDDYLMTALKSLPDPPPATEPTFLFPPANFNAVFLMMHTLKHFTHSVVLRQLCDWAVFLNACHGAIDFSLYRQILTETGFIKVADAITALTYRFLHLSPEACPPFATDPVLEDRILNDILHPLRLPVENRSLRKIIAFKIRAFSARKWKFDLIYPGMLTKIIRQNIGHYLRHPKVILSVR